MTPQTPTRPLCKRCQQRPVFVENGHMHEYCGRTCAEAQEGRKLNACLLVGCQQTGRAAHADFCSTEHAMEGVRKRQIASCKVCRAYPKVTADGFCNACKQQLSSPTITLESASSRFKELSRISGEAREVSKHFIRYWDPSGAKSPTLRKIYKVRSTAEENESYKDFKKRVNKPKEVRTFHSAQCICDLGEKSPEVCQYKSCGICSIIKSSFNAFEFGEPVNNGRFGEGIYSHKFAVYADRFATSCTSSQYRVTILSDAIVDSSTEIPEDESLFVPTPDAIIPRYVLMYDK
ncbi:uncharacterized protein EV420DRAFT_1633960 [Desarmillaria tabescens]|uniref:PARP catalytic domain-containing protein n=1 Tax=Armillaria tabescens TaxID=1929756 RepID=A0AA39NPM7_ARMTA|nr:uncharacterized protein EV420DRAFT_1633960 [Desarmillaria tabescens]KAK0469537.1 hypothetical protein EV420DRAFT_1633960 [Desarmillaria tabescens]